MPDKTVFSLRINKDTYQQIVKEARRLEMSTNDYIRMTLVKALAGKDGQKATGTDN